jgi:hypothetical protein
MSNCGFQLGGELSRASLTTIASGEWEVLERRWPGENLRPIVPKLREGDRAKNANSRALNGKCRSQLTRAGGCCNPGQSSESIRKHDVTVRACTRPSSIPFSFCSDSRWLIMLGAELCILISELQRDWCLHCSKTLAGVNEGQRRNSVKSLITDTSTSSTLSSTSFQYHPSCLSRHVHCD